MLNRIKKNKGNNTVKQNKPLCQRLINYLIPKDIKLSRTYKPS